MFRQTFFGSCQQHERLTYSLYILPYFCGKKCRDDHKAISQKLAMIKIWQKHGKLSFPMNKSMSFAHCAYLLIIFKCLYAKSLDSVTRLIKLLIPKKLQQFKNKIVSRGHKEDWGFILFSAKIILELILVIILEYMFMG